ncbi:thermonuclease family protein [Thiolapillus sp.]
MITKDTVTLLIYHRRGWMYWTVAALGLFLPWLTSCQPNWPEKQTACTVRSIYDGDTMTLKCNGERRKVRLYCIDAPEMKQKPWGRESRDYLRTITPKQVRVVEHGKDRYGRTIGEVWTADGDDVQENLNLAMVWAGRAVVYPKYCSDEQYYTAEASARQVKSGVWADEGKQQNPWEWRKN